MGLFAGVGDLLKQFSGDNGSEAGQALEKAAGAAPPSAVAGGLAEVFRSGQTPPFAQLASQLFSNSNGQQQASVLNTLLSAVGPGALGQLAGSSSSPLASLLANGEAPVTAEQAAEIKPEELQTLAEHAEKADPTIVDKLSQLYAAHPQLIQSLGAAAVSIAVQHMARSREDVK